MHEQSQNKLHLLSPEVRAVTRRFRTADLGRSGSRSLPNVRSGHSYPCQPDSDSSRPRLVRSGGQPDTRAPSGRASNAGAAIIAAAPAPAISRRRRRELRGNSRQAGHQPAVPAPQRSAPPPPSPCPPGCARPLPPRSGRHQSFAAVPRRRTSSATTCRPPRRRDPAARAGTGEDPTHTHTLQAPRHRYTPAGETG